MMKTKSLGLNSLLLLTLTWAVPTWGWGSTVDKIVAIVNNELILLSDMTRFQSTLSLRKEIDPLYGLSESSSQLATDRKALLQYLIEERLAAQAFKISDSEVEQEIKNVMKTNNLDQTQLEAFLKTKGFDYDDYSEVMRVGLQKRNLLDREIRVRVNISDDDVKNYYYNMALKDSANSLEYSLQMIIIQTKSFKSKKLAQDTAQAALQSIRQGEPFSDVAKRYQDGGSATVNEDSGYIAGDQLTPSIRNAIKGLRIGAVSDIIAVNEALYIIRLIDARSMESKKFEEDKEKIRETLAKVEYKRQLGIWGERARSSAFIKINEY